MRRAVFVEHGGLCLILSSELGRSEDNGDAYENATEPYSTRDNRIFPQASVALK